MIKSFSNLGTKRNFLNLIKKIYKTNTQTNKKPRANFILNGEHRRFLPMIGKK